MSWFFNNLGSILTIIVLAVITTLILRYLIKQKKEGKSSCGCGCSQCALNGTCHNNKKNKG